MNTVRSADGTTIPYPRAGQGPPPPGQNHMVKAQVIAPVLSDFFTVND